MDELQVFTYEKKEVRTIQKNGETWWVLKDVCGALGLSNPTVVADRLDDDERAKFDLGRQGETNIVNVDINFPFWNVQFALAPIEPSPSHMYIIVLMPATSDSASTVPSPPIMLFTFS